MIKKIKDIYKRRVIRFGKKLAVLQIKIMFTAAYFLFIVPFGIFFRIFARPYKSGWVNASDISDDIEDARRQF